MGSGPKAKRAYQKVASVDRDLLTKICTPLGIILE
jgi:hypothetical protein